MTETTATLGAAGAATDALKAREVDVSISGTFAATLVLERWMGGAWREVGSYTAPAEVRYQNAGIRQMRVRVSAWTSGAATVTVAGSAN
jgi:hypothetical protein